MGADRRSGGLWRHHDFRLLWAGETTSGVGTAVTAVALPLVAVTVVNASTFVVGVLNAAAWLPWLGLGLIAGAWVDRVRKRRLMLACDAVCVLVLLAVPIAAWSGVLTVGQLLIVALLVGASSMVFSTAYIAYLPTLVAPANLVEGNTKLAGSRSALMSRDQGSPACSPRSPAPPPGCWSTRSATSSRRCACSPSIVANYRRNLDGQPRT